MVSLLRRIDKELSIRIHFHRHFPNKLEFVALLNSISVEEKVFIAKKFCDYEWDIGSIRVLSILQECQILTATEYILRQTDEDHVKLVLYDFLEAEYNLLANLVESLYYNLTNSIRIQVCLENCFRQLIRDAIEHPDITNVQYLQELKALVPDKIYTKVIMTHMNLLLKLENTSIISCYKNLKEWQTLVEKNETLNKLLNEIVKNPQLILEELFKISSKPNIKKWKYFFILLGKILKNCSTECALIIKKHLKELFKEFISKKDKEYCYVIFLIARIAYENSEIDMSYSGISCETYSSWFKNTIGNMRYGMTTEQFKFVMSVLEEMIEVETDLNIIRVHNKTAINPPTHCNEIVLHYKQLCKLRIATLTDKSPVPSKECQDESNKCEESIIIDDDD